MLNVHIPMASLYAKVIIFHLYLLGLIVNRQKHHRSNRHYCTAIERRYIQLKFNSMSGKTRVTYTDFSRATVFKIFFRKGEKEVCKGH